MDLSQPANPIFSAGGGIVLPRHPATPPANMSPPTKVSSASNGSSVPSNAKAAFFSITNLVNGLRQQQQQENSSENGDHATSKGRHENFKNSFLLLLRLQSDSMCFKCNTCSIDVIVHLLIEWDDFMLWTEKGYHDFPSFWSNSMTNNWIVIRLIRDKWWSMDRLIIINSILTGNWLFSLLKYSLEMFHFTTFSKLRLPKNWLNF